MSSSEEHAQQPDDPGIGATESVAHDRIRRPGEIRRLATALLIVVLTLAAVAALSVYGARHNRRTKIGLPSTPLTLAGSMVPRPAR